MKFAMIPLVITCAILWGATAFLCGTANMLWPPYGESFLQLLGSIYPGYNASGSLGSVVIGTLYAMVDGGVGGLVFGLIYNLLVDKCCGRPIPVKPE